MLLHPTISQFQPHPQSISLSLSSFSSNSLNFPYGFPISPFKKPKVTSFIIKNSYSSSKVERYGNQDTRISLMGNPEKGAIEVVNQWENEGKKVTKWELCRVVKELRKFGRHKLALELRLWQDQQHGSAEAFHVFVLRKQKTILARHLI